MVVEVTINDKKIDDINQFTNTVDARGFLKSGINTLKVKLDTTLKNRINVEKPGGGGPGGGMGGPGGAPGSGAAPGAGGALGTGGVAGAGGFSGQSNIQKYGLTSVILIPYIQTVLVQ